MIRLTALVCLLFTALSFAAFMLEQVQPDVLQPFRTCRGVPPCFLGIMPDETPPDAASVLLGSAGYHLNRNEQV